MRNGWLVDNNLIESLGKPHIQFIALDSTSPDIERQMAALSEEKNSIVLFITDNRRVTEGEVPGKVTADTRQLEDKRIINQNAVLGTMQEFLDNAGIPNLTLHTATSPYTHGASIFLLEMENTPIVRVLALENSKNWI